MENKNVETIEGKLVVDDEGFILLESKEKKYFPVPYPPYVALPIEVMKMEAVSVYRDYIGQMITMAGLSQGELLYDARVIRTHILRDETSEYGESYWNNRVPKADILFKARKLPGHQMQFSVDVRQMITTNDSVIRKDLEANALMVEDPENCNEAIYRIYRHSRIKEINPYKYEYDEKIYGCEFFMYPYELRVLQQGDCDDWGIELASYLITAGVPEWRVRCVVGMTRGGGGHLTVCVLADDLKTWYHLNSTTPWAVVEQKHWGKLTDFPEADDPEDKIGIGDVWFSFNNKFAWHAFETHASSENARGVPWMKNFKITPRFD